MFSEELELGKVDFEHRQIKWQGSVALFLLYDFEHWLYISREHPTRARCTARVD